ncbi:MAG: HIT family protein [Planctomycetales bacterium]|nr:HIT family protein [Planctomycetales bacterium]
MATLFTKILQGEIPGRFVYRDDHCAAFLTIAPLRPGHTLVVPIAEVDHWIDLPEELSTHLFTVAQRIARGIQEAFQPEKVGMIIAGLEVRHVHIHLSPIWGLGDLNFERQEQNPDPAMLDDAMQRIRQAIDWSPQREPEA